MRILIPESQAMGSVACIRSLGRAGHTVVAMSPDPEALGFASRQCHESVVQPGGLTGRAWSQWLDDLVAQRQIDLILPSEGLVAALGPEIARFASLLPVGPDPQRLERFISKFELFSHFQMAAEPELRRNLPPMRLLRDGEPWQDGLTDLALPLFAKFDAVPAQGLAAQVQRYDSHRAALDGLPALLARYGRGLLQQFAAGQGVGVFFLRWNGQVQASLMHRRLHEVPHTGGVSSYRETWWDEALYQDALRRIESLEWWGVGMLASTFRVCWSMLGRANRLNPCVPGPGCAAASPSPRMWSMCGLSGAIQPWVWGARQAHWPSFWPWGSIPACIQTSGSRGITAFIGAPCGRRPASSCGGPEAGRNPSRACVAYVIAWPRPGGRPGSSRLTSMFERPAPAGLSAWLVRAASPVGSDPLRPSNPDQSHVRNHRNL